MERKAATFHYELTKPLPNFSPQHIKNGIISSILIGASIIGLESCKTNKIPLKKDIISQENALKSLERRLSKIEQQKTINNQSNYKQDIKIPTGPIKSITFRIGTKDDRLRIYWADGSSSDLPCTKEQSTWACG